MGSLEKRQWTHFINGAQVAPNSGKYLDEIDPRNGLTSFSIARGNTHDVEHAVNSAHAAFSAWRALRPIERGRILYKIAASIRAHKTELANIDQIETGRNFQNAAADIETAAQYFEYYAGLVNIEHGRVIDLGDGYHSYTRNEPFGVVGIVLPWNAPLNQAGRGIAPALATGNVVVAKPSEYTSVTLLALATLAVQECGLPLGVLNVVTGLGNEVGTSLVSQRLVRKIAFTGSVKTGQIIGSVAAERIIPAGLELGGKSPNIVFADADLDAAARGSVRAFVFNAGQVCSAGSRCLVERSVHDVFVEKLYDHVDALKIGSDADANIGPIITRAQFEKVSHYRNQILEQGIPHFEGGEFSSSVNPQGGGHYLKPLVLTGIDNEMPIAREEIFGPVLSVIPFDSEAMAIDIANDSEYGLVAGIWTQNLSRAHRVAARLEGGQVFINEYYAGGVETPFGGFKMSGHGREKGIEALAHYTQTKCVTVKL
jgi:aldehyde dehydrogenase (NAD+)